ncbi:hypothetical protein B0H19DRAFT_1064355 [Mycena capillaripes]|nr:hypothetical protein B0H19DRAFT_1064355 [Mycena capillaripes]
MTSSPPPENLMVLHAALEAEKARRAANGDATPNGDAPTHSNGSPSPHEEGRGTLRNRDEMIDSDEFRSQLLEDALAPYTLEEGRAYKRHKDLSGPSDADADTFLKTSNPMRHNFQVFVAVLQCRDVLEIIKNDANNKYKVPQTAAKTLQDWAAVAMLAPECKQYRDSKEAPGAITSAIVTAMRIMGVADLPPTMETGRCEVANKVVGKALIDKRCHIKTHVFLTLVPGTEKVNIATLTRNCIGSSPVKPTAAMYQRIALVRLVAVEYNSKAAAAVAVAAAAAAAGARVPPPAKSVAEDDFWLLVDKKLALWRVAYTKADMQIMVEKTYNDDVQAYGPPDNTIPIMSAKDLDAWLVTLNKAIRCSITRGCALALLTNSTIQCRRTIFLPSPFHAFKPLPYPETLDCLASTPNKVEVREFAGYRPCMCMSGQPESSSCKHATLRFQVAGVHQEPGPEASRSKIILPQGFELQDAARLSAHHKTLQDSQHTTRRRPHRKTSRHRKPQDTRAVSHP